MTRLKKFSKNVDTVLLILYSTSNKYFFIMNCIKCIFVPKFIKYFKIFNVIPGNVPINLRLLVLLFLFNSKGKGNLSAKEKDELGMPCNKYIKLL